MDEVKPQVQEISSQIESLRKESKKKKSGVEQFKEQIEAKQREVEQLKAEAEKTLANGQDPLDILNQKAALENQIQSMQEIIPQHGEPDAQERRQIEDLRKQLRGQLRGAIGNSQAFQDAQKELEEKIRDLKDFLEIWDQTTQQIAREFDSQETGPDLKIQDRTLTLFCKNELFKAIGNI